MKFLTKLCFCLLLTSPISLYAADEGQSSPQCDAVLKADPQKVDLSAYAGKVVLVDFWATWCGPCMKSMPFFNRLRAQHQAEGFEIVAINVDEDKETARLFLEQHPVDYVTAFDPEGVCPKAFEVKAMPSSFVLDKTGKVRHVHLGFRDSDQTVIREQIAALLAE